MKKKLFIYSFIACLGFSFTSCQDMLSPSSERHSYEVAQDTLYSYWGILRSMQNIAERYVVLGECRGELIAGTSYLSDSIQSILNFDMGRATDGSNRYLKAADYYHVINSCNAYLHSYDSLRTTGTGDTYMKKEAAQVSAIRAWTYLQLTQVYGQVPFYTQALLTSDGINSFMRQPEMVTITDLADKFVDELEAAARIERTEGFPKYESYGFTSTVAHSSKLMIPVNIILGDLFLAKGDAASCARAAQYYYNYLSGPTPGRDDNPMAGGILPQGYDFYGVQGDGDVEPTYYSASDKIPWTEGGAPEVDKESITAIASSTNKLWGSVLRGVNELYGYEASISVRTYEDDDDDDEKEGTTYASVSLEPKYDKKQLTGSQAYIDLCDAQEFLQYTSTTAQQSTWIPTVDPNVGDARRYWMNKTYGGIYNNGKDAYEPFIKKQNPGGAFTTTFPMIYRKSQIWLRFAEAICNAGYPSHAFAILRDGLCEAPDWLPTANSEDYVAQWQYTDENGDEHSSVVSKGALADEIIKGMSFANDEEKTAARNEILEDIQPVYANYPSLNAKVVVNYIARNEALNRPPYLNFNQKVFESKVKNRRIYVKKQPNDKGITGLNDDKEYEEGCTNGIHSRGCGTYKQSHRDQNPYDYVKMVVKKAEERVAEGKNEYSVLTDKESVYDPANKALVQRCVEDLIVDEEALELAFEGHRFFDLMRVAKRHNEPAYLANRLAKRDDALRGKLMDEKNWYFPLPQE